jgi:hypothetical protein
MTIALRDYTRKLPLELQVGSTESRIWIVPDDVQRLKSKLFKQRTRLRHE